jgi:hypothetical protein
MKTYKRKFLCGAEISIRFGSTVNPESQLARITINTGDSADIKIDGKQVNNNTIIMDLWFKQLETLLQDVQKKLKDVKVKKERE